MRWTNCTECRTSYKHPIRTVRFPFFVRNLDIFHFCRLLMVPCVIISTLIFESQQSSSILSGAKILDGSLHMWERGFSHWSSRRKLIRLICCGNLERSPKPSPPHSGILYALMRSPHESQAMPVIITNLILCRVILPQ